MSRRRGSGRAYPDLTCSACGATTKGNAVGNTRHRRCPGQPGLPPRVAHKKLPKEKRGKWEK